MKVAVIQLCSVLDFKVNLKKIDSIIKEAKAKEDVHVFFLPEVFYSMSNGESSTPHLVEKHNGHYKNIQHLAESNHVYLLGGTAATKHGDHVINRTYSFDPEGNEFPHYDKVHLFSIKAIKNKIDEAKVYTPGKTLTNFKFGKHWNIGLSVCFDIRFPEMYRELYKRGANIFTASSAFTVPTGRAHWETLLRARAIENQSYVIASAQVGVHNEKISTYGHSMIINPWGEVLACAKDKEGYITSEIHIDEVNKYRSRIDMTSKLRL